MTKEEALVTDRFHFGRCVRHIGRGGDVEEDTLHIRRAGRNQVWDDGRFRIPVRYGLNDSHVIHRDNVHLYHAAVKCPLLKMTDDEYDRLEGVGRYDEPRLEVPDLEGGWFGTSLKLRTSCDVVPSTTRQPGNAVDQRKRFNLIGVRKLIGATARYFRRG